MTFRPGCSHIQFRCTAWRKPGHAQAPDWIVITPTSFKKMLAELEAMNETVVPACLRQQAFFSI